MKQQPIDVTTEGGDSVLSDLEERLPVEDQDSALREAAEECRAREEATGQPCPVLVRVQPYLWRPLHPKGAQYVGWRKVSWIAKVKDFDQGRELRLLLDLFFSSLQTVGIRKLREALLKAQPDAD